MEKLRHIVKIVLVFLKILQAVNHQFHKWVIP